MEGRTGGLLQGPLRPKYAVDVVGSDMDDPPNMAIVV
jgi:hypothetical protein